jgi:uncharacterized membrane protein
VTERRNPAESGNDLEPIGAEQRGNELSRSRPDFVDQSEDGDDFIPEDVLEAFQRLIRRTLPVMVRREVAEYHSGPLPAPRTLKGYDEIVPGSAKKIIDNFDAQGKHRREMERFALRWDTVRSFAGLACGLIVTILVLWICYEMVRRDQAEAAALLAAADLAALAGVFVYGTRSLRKERTEKAKIMANRNEPANHGKALEPSLDEPNDGNDLSQS